MKRTLVAILALSPALAVAQGKVPAQPVSTPVFVASLNAPTGLGADNKSVATETQAVRVSTGVTAPELLSVPSVSAAGGVQLPVLSEKQVVVVRMVVDANGNPENVQIAQSAGPLIDRSVLAAVSRYHFKPGMLDGVATAVPVNLSLTLPASSGE